MASHGGIAGEPDCVLRWNAIPATATNLRIVIHFHGFAAPDEPLRLAQGRLPGSGLVLPRQPPTLALLPRGRPIPGRPGRFDWPALAAPGGMAALVAEVGTSFPSPAALVLTAHSGGGSGLRAALASGARVDEVHLFDALYGDPTPLLRWAVARAGLRGAVPPPALVVLARAGGGTEAPARRLAAGLRAAGLAGPRWRVVLTGAPHNDVPRLYGPALLADAGAPLPGTVPA
ncbi:hypothetical protein [Falsiroseomonas sp. E2-1-a20]|uniref:hypothetical protein n=1 Tax=Falsiroseomonas sp. E2-1-a20 TaxID=3239300 RepID=UPI003F2B8178